MTTFKICVDETKEAESKLCPITGAARHTGIDVMYIKRYVNTETHVIIAEHSIHIEATSEGNGQ